MCWSCKCCHLWEGRSKTGRAVRSWLHLACYWTPVIVRSILARKADISDSRRKESGNVVCTMELRGWTYPAPASKSAPLHLIGYLFSSLSYFPHMINEGEVEIVSLPRWSAEKNSSKMQHWEREPTLRWSLCNIAFYIYFRWYALDNMTHNQ